MDSKISEQIELLFGSVGVILGVFFAVFLLFNYKKQPRASLFLAIYLLTFSLRIGKSVFHYFYAIDSSIRNLFVSILLCVGPSLWLYTKYLTTPNSKGSFRDLIHYIPFFLIVPFCAFIPNNGPNTDTTIFEIFYNGIIVHMFTYCLLSIFWFKKNEKHGLVQEDKRKSTWLKYFLTVNFIFVILYFLISQLVFSFFIGLSFLFSCVLIFFSVWALKNPFLFKIPTEKYSNSTIDEKKAGVIIINLKKYIEEEKAYLNPSLTLSNLSDSIGIPVKELSQAINQKEKLNYSQFISKYRVEEAKLLLVSPAHKDFTIASIAYDCGFNSISSFNTIFKKTTNSTPLEYQKSTKNK